MVEGEEFSALGQIGEVLDSQPPRLGKRLQPGASRPILRGFSGERVRC